MFTLPLLFFSGLLFGTALMHSFYNTRIQVADGNREVSAALRRAIYKHALEKALHDYTVTMYEPLTDGSNHDYNETEEAFNARLERRRLARTQIFNIVDSLAAV